MKRTIVIATIIGSLFLASPRPAEAGFKSAMKKVGKTLASGAALAGAAVAVIAFCSSGQCS